MPIINLQILEGRPESKVKSLISALTDATSEHLEVPKERVRVIVQEIPQSRWAVGGEIMQDRKN
ncbi:2-hydroxymuconate tautomerase family protein [Pseudogracilibacillus sp. SE30717A]|uniref:2-hydroxymuconate tautomerase family protein n=1 Tax=Pseudogracilibacillus sp. SE30717A TaxID=3098293 RepID=UPI00300E4355